jgi:hypothetical protein
MRRWNSCADWRMEANAVYLRRLRRLLREPVQNLLGQNRPRQVMVRYNFTEEELVKLIDENDKSKGRKERWLAKAKKLTEELKKSPSKPIASKWSEIKSVYTKLQHGKCAFCERLLGEHELASVEFDVEHFRPKNAVKPWPPKEEPGNQPRFANLPRSRGKGKGYRFLAYHHLNYASSCKTCNSRLKANYFPIAGRHNFRGEDPKALLQSERPYLIYPLGDFDDDPENIIAFEGYLAVPRTPSNVDQYRYDRARVTIAFFRLNKERDDILVLRAKQLEDLLSKLEIMQGSNSAAKRKQVWQDIQRLGHEASHHAGCVRSLLRLYGEPEGSPPTSRALALEYLELARDYWRSIYKV